MDCFFYVGTKVSYYDKRLWLQKFCGYLIIVLFTLEAQDLVPLCNIVTVDSVELLPLPKLLLILEENLNREYCVKTVFLKLQSST